jgi:hypothetical protein
MLVSWAEDHCPEQEPVKQGVVGASECHRSNSIKGRWGATDRQRRGRWRPVNAAEFGEKITV